ncbi:aminomethyltransferase [Oceanicola sp. 22II-s10i]|uniref:CAF17-like 4Fe-4S cluster assembly/insertion protein YgfZ n=1 Tax=Oceanicola sp. 22II-s10i TaxID=1317116 RepID=UPI000B528AD5|nr:folate-binding protein YgfZ [Oceanicola sp. 22II-s10i]OWU85688.1 aminomethyltransferase [Oceanicola sp. 22II-s10i]
MGRAIYRITGPDARDFLQNLVTNDVRQLDSAGIVYAALLTPQGKYLADFFLVKDGESILLDVDDSLAAGLVQRLTMYKLRSKVQIEETGLGVSRGSGTPPEGAVADPRHPALGWRRYDAAPTDDGTDWDAVRVAHCIPETGIELTADTFILEAGFDRLHGVDFRKGCYVGQEVTARMKHKTELRKGLAVVDVDGPADPGAEIVADGKAAGVLHTRAGDRAIAYLRFDRAAGPMSAEGARVVWPQ